MKPGNRYNEAESTLTIDNAGEPSYVDSIIGPLASVTDEEESIINKSVPYRQRQLLKEKEENQGLANRLRRIHQPISFSASSITPTGTQHQLRGTGPPPTAMMKKPNRLPRNAPGHISSGCLLIPVFLAVWWYWTKKTFKRVIRGLLRSTPEPHQRHGVRATTGRATTTATTSSRRNNNNVSADNNGDVVEGTNISSNHDGGNYGYTRWYVASLLLFLNASLLRFAPSL